MKHEKSHVGHHNGDQVVCTCGWSSPIVDMSSAFTLGRKLTTPDQFFSEHLATVETAMVAPATEQAVAPAQKSRPRKPKSA